jgi:hypothetical protein
MFTQDQLEIHNRIQTLNELNREIDEFDGLFNKITEQPENSYNNILERIDPKERADLEWISSYAIYTNYYRNRFLFK